MTLWSATATFDDQERRHGKTVTLRLSTLAGADAGQLHGWTRSRTTTANITAHRGGPGHFTADNKVYDGNTDATVADADADWCRSAGDDVT